MSATGWKIVDRDGPIFTRRLEVPGGWIYRHEGAMTFVPRPVTMSESATRLVPVGGSAGGPAKFNG